MLQVDDQMKLLQDSWSEMLILDHIHHRWEIISPPAQSRPCNESDNSGCTITCRTRLSYPTGRSLSCWASRCWECPAWPRSSLKWRPPWNNSASTLPTMFAWSSSCCWMQVGETVQTSQIASPHPLTHFQMFGTSTTALTCRSRASRFTRSWWSTVTTATPTFQ